MIGVVVLYMMSLHKIIKVGAKIVIGVHVSSLRGFAYIAQHTFTLFLLTMWLLSGQREGGRGRGREREGGREGGRERARERTVNSNLVNPSAPAIGV